MNRRNTLIFLVIVVTVVIIIDSNRSGETTADYAETIRQSREERDLFMRTSPESPFAGMEEQFSGLKYFPTDSDYRINASLIRIEDPEIVTLPTNDGKQERYLEYGRAVFDFQGNEYELLILEIMSGPSRRSLFLAFGDATSAGETYGAGRYLDLKKVPGATSVVLDFNYAYNPYCAYNDSYSCTLPPRENLLPFVINAGERIYTDEN